MSPRPVRTRVIGIIELADPAAPSETWDQLVEGSGRSSGSSLPGVDSWCRDSEQPAPRGRMRDQSPRVPANVVQLGVELEDEFQRLCLHHLESHVSHRAD
jgi:hypothetical protein